MLDIMGTHYDALKQQLGLGEALASSSEDEKDSYIEQMQKQKKEFRLKMRDKRLKLKQMLLNRSKNPVDLIYAGKKQS